MSNDYIDEDGNVDEIARYLSNGCIQVKISYLKRFAAIKQMNIAFEFDFHFNSSSPFGSDLSKDFEFRDRTIRYMFYSGKISNSNCFSRLLGRKVINCGPIEESGCWPFKKEKQYAEFIVGCDSDGNYIKSTCNHNKLNTYFSSQPNRCFYLTPVAFKREVLKKYLDHPNKYRIEGNHLYCGYLWGIELDLDHDDYVLAYLGDLGRDLPESEYTHWLTYNVLTDEKLSDNTIKRDFFGLFSNSTNLDFVFKNVFEETKIKWHDKFGWDLFLELTDGDKYCYQKAVLPLVNEQHEFDSLCLTLSKITIDSINVDEIKKVDETIAASKEGSLNLLQTFLEQLGGESGEIDDIIEKMRIVQLLRSKLASHRKSSDLQKIYKKSGIDKYVETGDFVSASKIVFKLLIDALDGLCVIISNK